MPYAQLNGIHIVSAQLDRNGFDIIGEGAPAYDSALGLDHFTRRFRLAAPGKIEVSDAVTASKSHRWSEILHTDTSFSTGKKGMVTAVDGASLGVAYTSTPLATGKAEPNIVMGPGKPGSVDKGSL